MLRRLVVVGAGAKAAALAAKAAALRAAQLNPPELVILERNEVTSNWRGSHGYTDGYQPLGTPPEKDVGFPYECQIPAFGDIDQRALSYSWHSYLVGRDEYGQYVDRGKPHPTHHEWSRYLFWVLEQSGSQVHTGREVTKLVRDGGTWLVHCGNGETFSADGLVVTGPGGASRLRQQPASNRILDGASFWRPENLDFVESECADGGATIVVIGTGETTAAILMRLSRLVPPETTVLVLNRQGSIFSRGESFRENHQFTDPSGWDQMSVEHRREVIRRTDRGVFSQESLRTIDHMPNVTHRIVDVSAITLDDDGLPVVHGAYDRRARTYPAEVVIVAKGFEPDWFVPLLDDRARALMGNLRHVEETMRWDLSVEGVEPRLYAPMLAAVAQGAGFPNLSCLGHLSDRILASAMGATGR